MRSLRNALVIGILLLALPGRAGSAESPHAEAGLLASVEQALQGQERKGAMSNSQLFHRGRYRLETVAHEMRMSHWINAPILRDPQGHVLLDLSDNIWDLRAARETDTGLVLSLARYPDGATLYEVELQLFVGKAVLQGNTYPLARLTDALNAIKPRP